MIELQICALLSGYARQTFSLQCSIDLLCKSQAHAAQLFRTNLISVSGLADRHSTAADDVELASVELPIRCGQADPISVRTTALRIRASRSRVSVTPRLDVAFANLKVVALVVMMAALTDHIAAAAIVVVVVTRILRRAGIADDEGADVGRGCVCRAALVLLRGRAVVHLLWVASSEFESGAFAAYDK